MSDAVSTEHLRKAAARLRAAVVAHGPLTTCPTCDKCGAPVQTGAMALLCPLRTECEFWPEGETVESLSPWSDWIKPVETT